MRKFRIIFRKHWDNFPYHVEEKVSFFFWKRRDICRNMDEAEMKIREIANEPQIIKPRNRQVMKVYDESDLIVDKLKGLI